MDNSVALRSRNRGPVVVALLCIAAAFAVVLLNGAPLFYFDSLGYIDQGTSVLRMVLPDSWLELPPAPEIAAAAGTGAAPATGPTVNASRSAAFTLVLAGLYHAHLLLLFPAIALSFVVIALWLPMRVAARRIRNAPPVGRLVWLPLLVAAAGSLPFYIAFLMPDIFAPVLILVAATLFAFAPDMRPWELLLAAVIGFFCILVHPSHLLLAAGLVPVLLAGAVLVQRRGWWIAPVVMALLVAGGAGERLLFRSVVKAVANAETTYFPFLTARLIADGPGYAFLAAHCPDAAVPTCLLYDRLQLSDDPMRLTASNIIFKNTPDLGSFRRMPRDEQKRVVDFERTFARAVVAYDPVGVAQSLLRNTFMQASRNSIEMTIPEDHSVIEAARDFPSAGLDKGRLVADQSWLRPVERVHDAVYLASLAVIAVLILWPGRIAWQIRLFGFAILAGILVNAFVCGAVSQPADRYGGRVIWLLPMLAATLALFAWPPSHSRETRR